MDVLRSGRKCLARALELFMLALTAPSLVRSAITLAVYKKYVLAALLHHGALNGALCLVASSGITRPTGALLAVGTPETLGGCET